MLLTAQPLHAFDLDKVPGGELIVRAATDGREDDDARRRSSATLDAETVLVCDRDGPTGIAGIMGGQVSEVSDATTRVLLEVANWNGTNILRTSRVLGPALRGLVALREAAAPGALPMRAQRIASRLLVELCGAKLVPGTIDVAAAPPEPAQIRAAGRPGCEGLLGHGDRAGRPERLPGAARLRGRGRRRGPARSRVPPDRHYDVTREVDLIEEVGRVHGLDEHLPTTLPATAGRGRRPQPRAAPAAAGRGRRCATSASTRSSAGASPTPASRDGCGSPPTTRGRSRSCSPTRSPRSSRRCGRPCSARCSTSPRATSPAGSSGSRCSSPAAST